MEANFRIDGQITDNSFCRILEMLLKIQKTPGFKLKLGVFIGRGTRT